MKRKSDGEMLADYFLHNMFVEGPSGIIGGVKYRSFQQDGKSLLVFLAPSGKLRTGPTFEGSGRMSPSLAQHHTRAARVLANPPEPELEAA